jgi:hypothetical protein
MPAGDASFPAANPPSGEPGDTPLAPRWSVLLPLPLAGAYDYLAPPGAALAPGGAR